MSLSLLVLMVHAIPCSCFFHFFSLSTFLQRSNVENAASLKTTAASSKSPKITRSVSLLFYYTHFSLSPPSCSTLTRTHSSYSYFFSVCASVSAASQCSHQAEEITSVTKQQSSSVSYLSNQMQQFVRSECGVG